MSSERPDKILSQHLTRLLTNHNNWPRCKKNDLGHGNGARRQKLPRLCLELSDNDKTTEEGLLV